MPVARFAVLLGAAVGAGVLGVALSGDPAAAADRAGLAGAGQSGVTEASGPPGSRPAPALEDDGPAVVGPARSATRVGQRDRPGARAGLVTPVGDLVAELGRRVTTPQDRDRPRDDERHRRPVAATPAAPVTAALGAVVPDDGTSAPVRRVAASSRTRPATPAGTSLVPRLAGTASSVARPAASAGVSLVPRVAGTVSSVVTPVVRTALSITDSVLSRVIGLPCVVAPAPPAAPVVPGDPSSPPDGGPGLSPPDVGAVRPVTSAPVMSPGTANAPPRATGTWFPIASAPGGGLDWRTGRGGGDAAASVPGQTGLPARPVVPGEGDVAATRDGSAPAMTEPSIDTDRPSGTDGGSPPAPPAPGDRFPGVSARPG
ncbi:hypothetical protein AB0D32_27450 [Micromonospora sp. NPDC048170]|uniref:hypothetical protein n=1 Tax=Micromonospora sp. NPDC048170 TaxID=3154819 RepID=UPI0033DC577C